MQAARREFRREIPCLDGLRAISILLVLLAHFVYAERAWGLPQQLGQLGQTGVHVFFVISGYLITTLLVREYERTRTIRLRGFWWRRITRIAPAYVVYLLVVWLLVPKPDEARWWPALTYTSNLFHTHWWLIGHSWSLSVEEQFYLTWPLALSALGPRKSRQLAGVVFLATPLVRALVYVETHAAWRALFWDYDFIAAGAFLALWRPNGFRLRYSWLAPVAAVALSLLFVDAIRWRFAAQILIGLPLEAIAIALTLGSCLAAPSSRLGRVLDTRFLRWLGVISYSVYLWQEPFLRDDPPMAPLIGVPCAIAVAWLSFVLVERSGLRLRDRLPELLRQFFVPASSPEEG